MANEIVAQQPKERNLVRLMPANTAMGHLQRYHPELLTQSGALSVDGFRTAQDAANNSTAILRRERPELY